MKNDRLIALCVLVLTGLGVVLNAVGVFGKRTDPPLDLPRDITVLVTTQGLPAREAVVVTPDGLDFPVDPNTAQVGLPTRYSGELMIVRNKATRREMKRFVAKSGLNLVEI